MVEFPPGERRGKDYDDSERGRSKVFPADMKGRDYLKTLPEEKQIQVLGPGRYDLLKSGKYEWDDLFNKDHSLKLLSQLT